MAAKLKSMVDAGQLEVINRKGRMTLKLPDNTVKILIEGLQRLRIEEIAEEDGYFTAAASQLKITAGMSKEIEALQRSDNR